MIDKILEFSLRQRGMILFAAIALVGVGLWSATHLPIDAVPDITGVQVQINTEVPALAAGIAYAATDELHQHFVRGRHASPVDLGIDAAGVALGMVLWLRVRQR